MRFILWWSSHLVTQMQQWHARSAMWTVAPVDPVSQQALPSQENEGED